MAWNETTETETFDLDAAVAEHVERTQQETRRREEQKRRENELMATTCQAATDKRLAKALPAAARAALRLQPSVYWRGYSNAEATFTLDGEQWLIRPYGQGWTICNPSGAAVSNFIGDEQILDAIVQCAASVRAGKADEEQYRRERADQERQQAQEHAAIEREIADAKALAGRELWRWPDDVALTLYQWRWQRGRDEDGAGDYEVAWATDDELDDRGYLPLADGRVIRLIPAVHMPIVERRAFLATEELPYGLREQVTLSVPGVTSYTFYDEASDEHHQWYRRDENATLRLTIGHRPVKWVRALLTDEEPTSAPSAPSESEPVGADMPTLTNPAFDLPF